MTRIEQGKLIIEIKHPCPDDFLCDLNEAIISTLQSRELTEITDLKEYQESSVTLLELLKQINQKHAN